MALFIPRFLWHLVGIPKPTSANDGQALVWNDALQQFFYASITGSAPRVTAAATNDDGTPTTSDDGTIATGG
jgi:hypothetical protein